MSGNENEFEILMGSIGNRRRRGSFINEVLRARRQAGVEPGSTTTRRGPGGRPLGVQARPHRIQPQPSVPTDRRLVVKARVVFTPLPECLPSNHSLAESLTTCGACASTGTSRSVVSVPGATLISRGRPSSSNTSTAKV
jgi:hypothetical protein